MSVGANIRMRRIELHMTQQELADAMGYKTRSTIAKIESGQNEVSPKRLHKFAAVLDIPVDELLLGKKQIAFNNTAPTGAKASSVNTPSHRNKVVAIILAGGKSVRNHQNIPNQFINIMGKPVIIHCLEAYESHPSIDDIYVVCLKGWENILTAYVEEYQIKKIRGLIPAASSGILSVRNGLDFISGKYDDDDIVIFQESTRPMVSVEMISGLLQECFINGSANICQPMKDYVQFTRNNGTVEYIDRASIVSLQSPEAYRHSFIQNVFRHARQQQHPLTESCCAMLLYNLGYKINFIEGSNNNIKIVKQEDIAIFEALIKKGVNGTI